MTDVFLYDKATGRILQRTVGSEESIAAMVSATVGVVPYEIGKSDSTHKVNLATLRVVPI